MLEGLDRCSVFFRMAHIIPETVKAEAAVRANLKF